MSALAKNLSSGQSAGLGGILFTDRRQFYIPAQYKELWESVTPFSTAVMTNGSSLGNLQDPMFKMFEHRNPWQKQEMTCAEAVTVPNNDVGIAMNVNIADPLPVGLPATLNNSFRGLEFEVWDETKTTKRGICFISAVTDTDTATFKLLGTTPFTTVVGDKLVLVGHVAGEGHVAPEAWADDLEIVWGSTQIFRTAVEITGTLQAASLRGYSKELERLRKQKLQQHKILVEKALLRGSSVIGLNLDGQDTFSDNHRSYADSASVVGKARTTTGLISAIEVYGRTSGDYQNIFDFTAGLLYNQWVDATEKMFQYLPTSGVKKFFCGPKAISYWSKLADGGSKLKTGFPIQMSEMKNSKPDRLGYNFKYLETPFGIAELIYTPGLRHEYANYMVGASLENLYHAVYRPTQWFTNIKTDNRYDGIKDEYFSDEGLGISLIESHHIVKTPLS